jgi:hypothetical protein
VAALTSVTLRFARKQRALQMIAAMSVGLDNPPEARTTPNRLRGPLFKAQAICFGKD